jgi:hypothetical protein
MLQHVSDLPSQIRAACEVVASTARSVSIRYERIAPYAAALALEDAPAGLDSPAGTGPNGIAGAHTAAFWLTLDAINFGSGWFPTLRKRDGRSGYWTVALGIRDRFEAHGPWSTVELAQIEAAEIALTLAQDPDHELMALFAASLRDLGRRVHDRGGFDAVVAGAGGSAVALAELLSAWDCFADISTYDGRRVPFFKRAQIAGADLARAGAPITADLDRLTIFADNLVPHVLRLDGILEFDRGLEQRIDRGELLMHGAPAEVEIRACALHAVELIVSARPATSAAAIDELLWNRGAQPRYKARPRHRSRCTAY